MHVVKLSVSDVKTVLEPSVGSAIPENVVHILRSDMATVTYSWDTPGWSAATTAAWCCVRLLLYRARATEKCS